MSAHDDVSDGAYYSVSEAAAKLGVTSQRVRQLCADEHLKADKRGGTWLVDRSAVHERFATRPPRVKPDEEMALEEQRRLIDKLAQENRNLAERLGLVRASEVALRQEVEDLTRILDERGRELTAGREVLAAHRQEIEVLSLALNERNAKIDKLERDLRDGSSVPFGSRRRRLIRDPEDDRESC